MEIQARNFQQGDEVALAALINACDRVDQTDAYTTPERIAHEWQDETFQPERDGFLLLAREGTQERLVAAGAVLFDGRPTDGEYVVFGWLLVHPDRRGQGLEQRLLTLLDRRAGEMVAPLPAGLPRALRIGCPEQVTTTRQALEAFGMVPVRTFHTMEYAPLAESLPAPAPPPGVRLRLYREEDDEPLRRAFNAAFADHWGAHPVSADQWTRWFKAPPWRPDLWIVAEEEGSGEIVGFCLGRIDPEGNAVYGRQVGWIEDLGVCRPWRRRGLGTALLLRGMIALREAGMTAARLRVDATSLTGANRLYERVGYRVIRRHRIYLKPIPFAPALTPRTLEGGLVLRQGRPQDREALVAFNREQLVEEEEEDEDEDTDAIIADWTRTLLGGWHPTTGPACFTVVEVPEEDRIVSSAVLIPQRWSYEEVPFGVGRMELVSTHPDYRRRGLVRAQFEVLHGWCQEHDLPVQAITGIPYFYRRFGYGYALELGGGYRLPPSAVPSRKGDEEAPFALRDATLEDLPALMAFYERACRGSLVRCLRSEAVWRYLLTHAVGDRYQVIVDGEGKPVGYLATFQQLWRSGYPLRELAVGEGVALAAVLPPVVRALGKQGEALAKKAGKPLAGLFFAQQPARLAASWLRAHHAVPRPAYAWYLRVADLAAFLRRIGPALERHLANSILVGHTGELRLDFYTGGLRLAFEEGRLAEAENLPPGVEKPQAGFPPGTFLALLFGYRSLDDLRRAYPDVWTEGEAQMLLEALFPPRPSWVLPLH